MTLVLSADAMYHPVCDEFLSNLMVTSTANLVTLGLNEILGIIEGNTDGLGDGTLELVGASVLGFPATNVCTLSRPNCLRLENDG